MTDTASATIVETAERLFTAITNGDHTAVANLWSDDIAVWRTGGRRGPTAYDDKSRALRVISWFLSITAERSYEVLDRQVFDGGFVQQHLLHATGHAGQSIAMRVCIVIKVDRAGLIDRIEEYFDPGDLAPLLDRQGE